MDDNNDKQTNKQRLSFLQEGSKQEQCCGKTCFGYYFWITTKEEELCQELRIGRGKVLLINVCSWGL